MTEPLVAKLREAALRPSASRWRRRRAVRRLASHGTAAAAQALAEVLGATLDAGVADTARRALAGVRDGTAIDKACEVLIATGDDELTALARQQGWLPSDPARRALMLFLLGEFDRYAEFDFDGSLLGVARAAVDGGLRTRLADRARDSGRVEWVRAVAGREQPLGGLADAEWEVLIATLTATRRWEQMWGLVRRAPPAWGVRILNRLDEHEWRPVVPGQRAAFDELIGLARASVAFPDRAPFEEVARLELDRGAYGVLQFRDLLATADGMWLIVGGDGALRVWKLPANADEQPLLRYSRTGGDATTCRAITSDGAMLFEGDRYGSVGLWSLVPPPCGRRGSVHAHAGAVRTLAVTPGSSLLLSQGYEPTASPRRDSQDGAVLLWQVPSGKPAGVVGPCRLGSSSSMVVSPDGTLLATWGAGRIWLWRLPWGSPVGTLELPAHPPGRVSSLAITPDNRMLVATIHRGRRAIESELHMWWIPEGIPAGTVPDTGAYGVAMSPSGELLADAGRDGVTLRRLPSGTAIGKLADPAPAPSGTAGYERLAFTIDGRFLVGSAYDRALVWRIPEGDLVATLPVSDCRLLSTQDGALLVGADRADTADNAELVLWRYRVSAIDVLARKPIAEIALDEIERLRSHAESDSARALTEFTAALVRRHHADDIELAEPTDPTDRDIEISG